MPRKNRSTLDSFPLEMTQQFSKIYPGVWEKIKLFAESLVKVYPWNPLCIVPTDLTASVAEMYESKDSSDLGMAMHIIYSWRQYKKVYCINQDLAELLMDEAKDSGVPTETLLRIPYPSLYLEFDGWKYEEKFIGAFVNFDAPVTDMKNFSRSLEIEISLVDGKTGIKLLPIVIDEKMSIYDSCKFYAKMAIDAGIVKESYEELVHDTKQANDILQLVLYLCAINSEVEEDSNQKRIYKKDPSKGETKDVFREIQKFNVGVRIGQAIKTHKTKNSNSEISNEISIISKKGSKKRPHVRRSHFHHYWVGSGDNKRLELKFLAPAYINFSTNTDNADELLDTVKHTVN